MIVLNRPTKDMFYREMPNPSWSIISILRLVGVVTEIVASLVASVFTGGATIPLAIGALGTSFQFGLDYYQYQNNQLSGRDFAISSLVNALSFGLPYAVKPIIRRVRTGAVAIKGYKHTKYVIRGAESFKEAIKNASINPSKFTKLSIYQSQKLFRTSQIPSKYIISGSTYQNAFNKAFGNYYKFNNRDRSTLNSLVRQYAKNNDPKKVTLELVERYWNRLSDNGKLNVVSGALPVKALQGVLKVSGKEIDSTLKVLAPLIGESLPPLVASKTIGYSALSSAINTRFQRLASLYQSQKTKPLIQRFFYWFGSRGTNNIMDVRNIQTYGGYRFTQMAQRLDPTNLARDAVKGIYYKLNKYIKQAGKNIKELALNKGVTNRITRIDEIAKTIVSTSNIRNKRFYEIWKNTSDWVKRKFVYLEKTITKADGHKFNSMNYVLGYQVVQNQTNHQILRIFFNPITTHAFSAGSKNLGGKAPVIIRLSKAQIQAWKKAPSAGRFYNKGSKVWPPIATSAGGRIVDWAKSIFNGLGDLLTFLPISGLRNLLSVASNLKQVSTRIIQGTFKDHFFASFVPSFLRNLTSQGAKYFGRLLATKAGFSVIGKRILQKLSVGTVQLFTFQSTKTITLSNGKKIKAYNFGFHGKPNIRKFGTNVIGGSIKSIGLSALRSRVHGKSYGLIQKYGTKRKLQTYRRPYRLLTKW